MPDTAVIEVPDDNKLNEAIATSFYVREMMQTEGMKRVRAKIDEMTGRMHAKWLTATPEEAEQIRKDTYGLGMFFTLVSEMEKAGKQAKYILERKKEDLA